MTLRRVVLPRLVLLLFVLGLAQVALGPRAVEADTPPTICAIYPIPVNLGVSAQPSVSGDGSRVAFWSTSDDFPGTDNTDGNVEIFVQLGTSGVFTRTRQVTRSNGTVLGGFNLGPAISGDGKRIAFFSDRDLVPGRNTDGNFELFLADLSGLAGDSEANIGLSQVTSSTAAAVNTWPSINSPAISDTFAVYYIAFASDQNYTGGNPDGNTEIFRAKIDGAAITFVQVTSTTADFTNDFPAISEDGSRIAFATNSNSPGSAAASVSVAKIGFSGVPELTELQTFSSQTSG
jgi:Tol biopolymer transport system component